MTTDPELTRSAGRPSFELTIDPELDQLSMARSFVVNSVLQLGGSAERLVDDAELMAGEGIANAVLHARTPVVIGVQRIARGVNSARGAYKVSVRDESRTPLPPAPACVPPDRTGGRGLAIINTLAENWGVTPVRDDGRWSGFCSRTTKIQRWRPTTMAGSTLRLEVRELLVETDEGT